MKAKEATQSKVIEQNNQTLNVDALQIVVNEMGNELLAVEDCEKYKAKVLAKHNQNLALLMLKPDTVLAIPNDKIEDKYKKEAKETPQFLAVKILGLKTARCQLTAETHKLMTERESGVKKIEQLTAETHKLMTEKQSGVKKNTLLEGELKKYEGFISLMESNDEDILIKVPENDGELEELEEDIQDACRRKYRTSVIGSRNAEAELENQRIALKKITLEMELSKKKYLDKFVEFKVLEAHVDKINTNLVDLNNTKKKRKDHAKKEAEENYKKRKEGARYNSKLIDYNTNKACKTKTNASPAQTQSNYMCVEDPEEGYTLSSESERSVDEEPTRDDLRFSGYAKKSSSRKLPNKLAPKKLTSKDNRLLLESIKDNEFGH